MYRAIQKILGSTWAVLTVFWLTLFILYLPALHSGWVSDTLGWLDAVRHQSFTDYVNRLHTGLPTFYQSTQITTWSLYQVFGASHWAWYIIHISLHAVNCTLLYIFCRGLLSDSSIKASSTIAFAAAVLFCTSPYVTEVIVWKASFHYLQGFLFILIILLSLRRFMHRHHPVYALAAGLIFLISAFSLEVFYLTPLFTLSLLIYYRLALRYEALVIRRSAFAFLLPQVLLFIVHLVLVRVMFGTTTARLGDELLHRPITYYAIRPPDYLFHLLGGRFLTQALRTAWHALFCTYVGAALFYGAALAVLLWVFFRLPKLSTIGKAAVLFLAWLLLSIALVMPLWFPERLLIIGDRYLYIVLPPFFMLAAILVSQIKQLSVRRTLFIIACILNISLTCYLTNIWKVSARISDALQQSIPIDSSKITLLLNAPGSLRGAPMIGAASDDEFLLMHNSLYPTPILSPVHEVLAYNMVNPEDGATVAWLNDTTVLVTLKSAASQWTYTTDIAHNYATPLFSVSLSPDRRSYTLHLKGNPSQYQLLYQKGSTWYPVTPTRSHTNPQQ